MSLKGSLVTLRAVEKDDAGTIFRWENNPANWKVSNTEVPFSLYDIHQLIEQQSDIRKSGQMRLVIETSAESRPVGVIDLYDLNFKHGYAAIGILIAADADKGKVLRVRRCNYSVPIVKKSWNCAIYIVTSITITKQAFNFSKKQVSYMQERAKIGCASKINISTNSLINYV